MASKFTGKNRQAAKFLGENPETFIDPGFCLLCGEADCVCDVGTEEDGEDVFTPMPKRCRAWRDGDYCDGKVVVQKGTGFHVCEKCGVSYGK